VMLKHNTNSNIKKIVDRNLVSGKKRQSTL
jgi:hypothetical protein